MIIVATIVLIAIWATDPDHREGRPGRRLMEMAAGAFVLFLMWSR